MFETTHHLPRLEKLLGHTFQDRSLLVKALTHRSWVEEHHPGGRAPAHESGQRLEYLGDAWLDYVVARWLYDALPLEGEGELTRRRAALVDQKALQQYATTLGLTADDIRLGRGERLKADTNKVLLGDTLEALVGAVLLDGGPEAATALVKRLLPATPLAVTTPGDPISTLNQWHQKRYQRSPDAPEFECFGPDHALEWSCSLEVDGLVGRGRSRDKQDARRQACAELLHLLGVAGW